MPRPRKLTKKQLAAIDAEIKRLEGLQAIDPVRVYKPGPTCRRCMESPKRHRLINGGNQVGKTAYAVWECAAIARGLHPIKTWFGPCKILVVIPSRQQAVALWGKRLLEASEMPGEIGAHPYIPAHEIERVFWNYSGSGKAPGRIVLKNGSDIIFAWAGDDSMWERIQGIKFDYCIRDEAVGNSRLGPELELRLIAARSDESKRWAGGILWVGTPTLDNEEYEDFQRRCREGKPDYEEFFIFPHENPAVSMAAREELRDAMSEDDAAVRLDGGMSDADRRKIYRRHWSDERHVAATDYEPGPTDNLWIVFDPGMDHPAGILCAAINAETPDTIRVVRFSAARNMPLSYHMSFMAEWLDGRALEGLVVDPKAFTRESSGKSIVSQFDELLGSPEAPFRCHRGVLRPRNQHWDGINLVWRYLDENRVIVNPLSPGCALLRHQITSYRGREETKYTGPHGVVKKNDEGPDCLRYLITLEPYYEDRGPNPRRGVALVPPVLTPDDLHPLVEANLSPELRRHHEHLRKGAARMAELMGELDEGRQLATAGGLEW